MFVRLLQQIRPIRGLPTWARWLLTALLVLAFFFLRVLAGPLLGHYPFLLFFPAIIIASFVFDRGSGFLAVFLASALALYYFVEPVGDFMPRSSGDVTALLLFVLIGLLLASLMEALRATVDQLDNRTRELEERTGQLERARAEAQAHYALLDGVIDGTPDVVYVKDRDGRFVHVNNTLCQLFGVPRHAILGRRDRDFLPPEQADAIEAHDRAVMTSAKATMIEEMIDVAAPIGTRTVARHYLSTKAPWFDERGEIIGLIGISRDYSERRSAEIALETADRQKALMLSDINHRIKNHLTSISAMLSLSSRQIASVEDARRTLDAAAGRLGVISRVYDRLQLRANQATVRADDFLPELCSDLRNLLVATRPIVFRVNADPVDLDPSQAVTIGLIVNELIQNAVKYAFPDGRAGTVSVSLACASGNCRLEVADDGIGWPAEPKTPGQGSRLLRALSQQLRGTLEVSGPPGTQTTVRFELGSTDMLI